MMKSTKKFLKVALLLVITLTLYSFDLPDGWLKEGNKPDRYDIFIESSFGQDGKTAVTIKSNAEEIDGFGTLMQTCLAYNYLGKRVRMSGWLKTENVSGWAGLWLRVDEINTNNWLSFDNMKDGLTDRAVSGTTDWMKYDIVLDVPIGASILAYGALLFGTGQIWFDNLSFEIVDDNIPTTGLVKESTRYNKEPVNLDFEK